MIRPVSLQITMTYRGSLNTQLLLKLGVRPIHGHVWHNLRTPNYKPTQTTLLVCLFRDAPCVSQAIEGSVTRYERREVGQKSHREVGGSRMLDWDVGGLDFAGQFRDVGGFVSKRFSPKQRHQIHTNKAI